ncbi:hypothetical protein D3C87_442240 [compost metagenome]
MKKLLLSLLFIGFAATGYGQTTWTYDFGITAKAPYTTNGGTSTNDYLPVPTQIPNGGSSFVRIGGGAGSLELINPGFSGGSGAELKGVASTSTSVNKTSIFGFDGSKAATIKFRARFDGGASGTWTFTAGNGASFSDGNGPSSSQTFTGVRWAYGASDAITTTRLNSSGNWVSGGITATPFTQKNNHEVELYINNDATSTTYLRGTSQSLDAGAYDLWVNGAKVITNTQKAEIGSNVFINSFMFTGISSTGNVAQIFLDDFIYSNFLPSTTLPVSLSSFTAKANLQNVDLAWNTSSEKDNSHFEIFRSGDGKTFSKIGEVKGSGTTNLAQDYTFVDKNALPGTSYYQLSQVDYDGKSTPSKVEAVKSNVTASNFKIAANKQEGTVKLTVFAANEGLASFKIYDLNGRKVAEKELSLSKGYSNISVPFSSGNGLHIASLTTANETVTQKFIQ